MTIQVISPKICWFFFTQKSHHPPIKTRKIPRSIWNPLEPPAAEASMWVKTVHRKNDAKTDLPPTDVGSGRPAGGRGFLFEVMPGFSNFEPATPLKSNIDTQNDAMLKRRCIFQGPSFLVSMLDFAGVYISIYVVDCLLLY